MSFVLRAVGDDLVVQKSVHCAVELAVLEIVTFALVEV